MNVATRRLLSAADLNFNPARFPLGRLADFAREHWGVEGELTPIDGERDQNHRVREPEQRGPVSSLQPRLSSPIEGPLQAKNQSQPLIDPRQGGGRKHPHALREQ